MSQKTLFFLKLFLIILLLIGCGTQELISDDNLVLPREELNSRVEVDSVIEEPIETTATLVVVGDIMVHDTQIAQAYDPTTKTYNFDESLLEVSSHLNSGDLTLGNLETTLAGQDLTYSSYPLFNTPESLAETLKKFGFDILFTSNNHSFDRKEVGVIRTIEHLKSFGLEHVGTRMSPEEQAFLIKDINGIKIALFAYTYGLNGLSLPQGKEYLVNLLKVEQIVAEVQQVKEQVDLVVCYLHFGQEYSNEPSQQQREVAQILSESGVNIILGSHPHVLQEVKISDNREKAVFYSMGNFVSSQKGLERQTSAIFKIYLSKNLNLNKTIIQEVKYIPIYTYRYKENILKFKVLPIEDSLQNKSYDFIKEEDYVILEKALNHVENIMSSSGPNINKEIIN